MLLITLGIFNVALAGPSSGGGGMAVECRYDQSRLGRTTVELLDTYEARLKTNLTLLRPSGDVEEDYLRLVTNTYRLQGMNSVDEDLKQMILQNLRNFFKIVDWSETPLEFLGDQGKSPDLPFECQLRQLAIFFDSTERVKINRELFNKMNSLDQAALIVHELFYKYERMFRESTSESTRSYVGQVLALSGNSRVDEGAELAKQTCSAIGTEKVLGSNPVTVFHHLETRNIDGTKDTVLQFEHIGGRPLLVKTTVTIPNFSFDVQRSFVRQEPYTVSIPSNPGHDFVEKFPIQTEHRSDWEVLIRYQYPEPITFTLIQDGAPVSTATLSSCN